MKRLGMMLLTAISAVFAGGCCCKEITAMPENAVLIDVRSAGEFQSGHLEGAVNIPHGQIADIIPGKVPDKNTPLYLYCRSGRRVKIAVKALKESGYTQLSDLGGMNDAAASLSRKIVK